MEQVTKPVVVLDTSVLWGRRIRSELIRAIEADRFIGVWSEWIVGELWRGLAWQWAVDRGVTDEDRREMSASANRLMRILAPRLTLVSYTGDRLAGPWPSLADPQDEPIWTTAVTAHASYVVSANTRDFPPNVAAAGQPPRHSYFGIDYLTPEDFLSMIWGDDADDAAPEPAE